MPFICQQIPVLCFPAMSFPSPKSRCLPAYLTYLAGISNSVFPKYIWPFVLCSFSSLLHSRRTNTIHTAVQARGPGVILEATVSTTHWPTSSPSLSPFGSISKIHLLTQAISLHLTAPLPVPALSPLTWTPGIALLLFSRLPSLLLIHSLHSSWVEGWTMMHPLYLE